MNEYQTSKPRVHVARTVATCVALAASAYVETHNLRRARRPRRSHLPSSLSAGGILCFPLYASNLAAHLKLNQPQLSTVALALVRFPPTTYAVTHASSVSGMSGQYLLAPLCGQWVDRFGPWTTSLSASILFASGWGWFAYEIHRTTYVGPESPEWPFRRLVVACFLCGVATASSYVAGLRILHDNSNTS